MEVLAITQARYGSTRLPAKELRHRFTVQDMELLVLQFYLHW